MTTDVQTTTAATLSDEQVAAYRQQGFIHIPGIIAPDEVAAFRVAAVEALDADTTYDATKHVVTDPLGLAPGEKLDGALVPRVRGVLQ